MARLEDYLAQDRIKDMAKGRFSFNQIMDFLSRFSANAKTEGAKEEFEYCMIQVAQALHYEYGFDSDEMSKFFHILGKQMAACDRGVYSTEDGRNALYEDAGWILDIKWIPPNVDIEK